jgi:amidase
VAGDLVDFALGTDTGGSVRIPASFCGICGIRPTHGRLSLEGVVGQAPSFDTVGWFARDADLLARIGEVLLASDLRGAARPRHVIIATDAFAIADPATAAALLPAAERIAALVGTSDKRALSQTVPLSDWFAHQRAVQGREAWATFGDWIDRHNPRFAFEVADNFLRGARVEDAAVAAAAAFRAQRRAELSVLLDDRTAVCLPTTPFPAPLRDQPRSVMWERRNRVIMLTCLAGMLGTPQLSLPLGEVDGLPVGLSILARPGGDGMLLALAAAEAEGRTASR